ncbi:MAG: hypothetical protein HPY50_03005 [Firmicutes bacterium]|nr:hypothetical protein [Bacillota bacterium]
MKHIQSKTKKWLTVAGLSIVCLALVIAISSQFKKEPPVDGRMPPGAAATGEVNLSEGADGKAIFPNSGSIENPAAQTDQPVQNLQPEVTKPAEPTTAQKTDPSQKPSGEKVDKVQPTDHDSVKKPDSVQTGEPRGGEKKDGQVYLPGFGWVTETGGSGTTVGNEGDELTGNKVGKMD